MGLSIKVDVQELCTEIAREFPGWGFSSDMFRNKTLKHTDLIVRPFSHFKGGMCHVQPSAALANKKVLKLYTKMFVGEIYAISIILFQRQSAEYRGLSCVSNIWREKTKTVMGA